MTPTTVRSRTALVCLIGYVVLSGWLQFHSVHHAFHHSAHHDAATHASPVCTWLCAAGTSIHSIHPIPDRTCSIVGCLEGMAFSTIVSNAPLFASPRSPPRS